MAKALLKRLIAFFLFGIMILAAGCNIGQKQPEKYTGPTEKISLGVGSSLHPSAVWIAKNKGYFQEQGLDVEIKEFDSGKNALKTMLNEGGLDIVTVAQTPIVQQL